MTELENSINFLKKKANYQAAEHMMFMFRPIKGSILSWHFKEEQGGGGTPPRPTAWGQKNRIICAEEERHKNQGMNF